MVSTLLLGFMWRGMRPYMECHGVCAAFLKLQATRFKSHVVATVCQQNGYPRDNGMSSFVFSSIRVQPCISPKKTRTRTQNKAPRRRRTLRTLAPQRPARSEPTLRSWLSTPTTTTSSSPKQQRPIAPRVGRPRFERDLRDASRCGALRLPNRNRRSPPQDSPRPLEDARLWRNH